PPLVPEGDRAPDDDLDEVHMAPPPGDDQVYTRAGKLHFEVNGAPTEVTLYASQDDPELFLPFRDATSGKETYGAGRYVEVHDVNGDHVVVDFNTAYNPNCAYNSRWSCPLPRARTGSPFRSGRGRRASPAPRTEMGRLVYSAICSVDGYVADQKGN